MIKQIFTSLILGVAFATSLSAQGFSGSYLAASSANIANDYEQAALYYRRALVNDPSNGAIMQSAMVASIAAGHFDDGAEVAQRMVDAGFADEYAGLNSGVVTDEFGLHAGVRDIKANAEIVFHAVVFWRDTRADEAGDEQFHVFMGMPSGFGLNEPSAIADRCKDSGEYWTSFVLVRRHGNRSASVRIEKAGGQRS